MLHELTLKKDVRTFSVSPENPTGAKGAGGRATLAEGSAANAARDLGQGWKVNPYVRLEAGKTAVLADICGEGAIKHFWITDSAHHGRELLLRIFFKVCPSSKGYIFIPCKNCITWIKGWLTLTQMYDLLPTPLFCWSKARVC